MFTNLFFTYILPTAVAIVGCADACNPQPSHNLSPIGKVVAPSVAFVVAVAGYFAPDQWHFSAVPCTPG